MGMQMMNNDSEDEILPSNAAKLLKNLKTHEGLIMDERKQKLREEKSGEPPAERKHDLLS